MFNYLKALSVVSVPVLVVGFIFKITILSSYVDSKNLEFKNRVNRQPAVISKSYSIASAVCTAHRAQFSNSNCNH